jgi:predicted metal-binding membrane protein
MTAGTEDLAQVRRSLHTIAALAWLLIAVETISGGRSMEHRDLAAIGISALPSLAASWLLMLTAMMTPLLGEPVVHLRARSLARSRTRVVILFTSGYLTIWLIAGGVLSAVATTLLRAGPAPALAAVLTAGLAWHATPARGRCLNRTRGHPALPAFGRASNLAAVRYGFTHAGWCVGTCWAPMLLPLVVVPDIEPVVMGAAALWLTAERLERPTPPRWRLPVPTAAARTTLRTIHTTHDRAINAL